MREIVSASQLSSNNNQEQNNILESLGFEEGELEMFFETTNVSKDDLVNVYLQIAQNEPYNLDWDSERTAINAEDTFNVNGNSYTKHDIANDTLNHFYYPSGGRIKQIYKKTRKSRKYRASKKRIRRKHTRRYRRRH